MYNDGLSTNGTDQRRALLHELDQAYNKQFKQLMKQTDITNEAMKLFKTEFSNKVSPKGSLDADAFFDKVYSLGYHLYVGHVFADEDQSSSESRLKFLIKVQDKLITGVQLDAERKSKITGSLLKQIFGLTNPKSNHFCFKVKGLMQETTFIGLMKANQEIMMGQMFNSDFGKPSEGKAFQVQCFERVNKVI